MRRDRGTTLAAILVLLCCIGGTAVVGSIVTNRVFIASVTTASPSRIVKMATQSHSNEADIVHIMCEINGYLHLLADIVELHNLPPPSGSFA